MNCPICGKVTYGAYFTKHRKNLTCGLECRKAQRAIRQKQRRAKAELFAIENRFGTKAAINYLKRNPHVAKILGFN